MNLKSIFLIIILGILISGCIEKRTSSIIEKWNEIKEKEYQIEKILMDNAAFQPKDIDEWIRYQQNTIGKLEILIQEEDRLISDFAGLTVNVKGDLNKYANEALTNIRETYKYRINELENLKELVRAKQIFDDKLYLEKKSQLDIAESKVKEYYTKANDAMRKFEALE